MSKAEKKLPEAEKTMSKEEARKDNKPEAPEELDEADQTLKDKLELLVTRLSDREPE
jgi:hypothetical protein